MNATTTNPVEKFRRLFAEYGFNESGGGDDFFMFSHPTSLYNRVFYVYDNGSWEYHDLEEQKNDRPESASARGTRYNRNSLRFILSALMK